MWESFGSLLCRATTIQSEKKRKGKYSDQKARGITQHSEGLTGLPEKIIEQATDTINLANQRRVKQRGQVMKRRMTSEKSSNVTKSARRWASIFSYKFVKRLLQTDLFLESQRNVILRRTHSSFEFFLDDKTDATSTAVIAGKFVFFAIFWQRNNQFPVHWRAGI